MLRTWAVIVLLAAAPLRAASQPFSWDNAIVYFVLMDRFANGDPTNDHAYGRGLAAAGSEIHKDSPARFHGGDLKGLTEKVRDGYFSDLGVNAIWISSPLEQVHGWVGGPNGAYPSYAYHGYWPLDFTAVDSSFGTEADLAEFVDACHARDIRVVMDVVMNHAGYNTLQDMSAFEFGTLKRSDWRTWRPGPGEDWSSYHGLFIDYADSEGWSRWWGGEWMRAGLGDYPPCGSDDLTTCTSSLPDFRTESSSAVPVPDFLQRKWRTPSANTSSATESPSASSQAAPPRAHLVAWLTSWVRKLGIDGFRLDTARNLDLESIAALKRAGLRALSEWKRAHPDKALDDAEFWMTGEVFGHRVERSAYFDAGLNSVINFDFQYKLLESGPLDSLYSEYASRINTDASFNVLSYISSHDTRLFDRSRLREAATALMLVPGAVQIFYGDETGRMPGPDAASDLERTRSPMNWESIDRDLLDHWIKLGTFRGRHPALARGDHTKLADEPYTFHRAFRHGADSDDVVVIMGASGRTRINVSKVFPDNTILRDAYSGSTAFVSYGMVYVDADPSGLILLEELK